MTSDEFTHESLQDAKSIGQYLRRIAEGLESGTLEFSDDRGEFLLRPKGLLGLELRAKRKGSRARIHLRVSWTEENTRTRPESLEIRTNGSADAAAKEHSARDEAPPADS